MEDIEDDEKDVETEDEDIFGIQEKQYVGVAFFLVVLLIINVKCLCP